jgi:AAA15 family ATPase/GTPase
MPKNIFVEDININSYKSLKSFVGKDFGKINLITGKNNVGKTSLLEALFLNLGPTNPSLALNVLARHGLSRLSPKESNIKFLFSNHDSTTSMKFKVKTRNHGTRDLEIKLRDAVPDEAKGSAIGAEKSNSKSEQNLGVEPPKILENITRRVNESTITSKLLISDSGVFPLEVPISLYPQSVYISSEMVSSFENEIDRYDYINKENLVSKFEEILKTIEPALKRTSLGLNNSLPTILADTGNGLVPLSLLGSGSQKLARIFLSLANANNAVLLIDEFEGSFHYSSLIKIWESIMEFVKNNNTQIFATTHSGECLKAAYEVAKEKGFDDLVLHRLERQQDETKLFTFSGEKLDAMLEGDWDLR